MNGSVGNLAADMRSTNEIPSFESFLVEAPAPKTARVVDAARLWIEHERRREERGEIAPATIRNYLTHHGQYLVPQFGTLDCRDITWRHIVAWIKAVRSERSKATVRKEATNSRTFFRFCLNENFIEETPWRDVPIGVVPSKRRGGRSKRAEMVMEIEEVRRLLRGHGDAEGVLFYALIFLEGLRPSEACELRWGDINRAERRITVSRSYDEKAPPKKRIKCTKSGVARDVPEHPEVRTLLDYAYARRTFANRAAPQPNELVCLRKGKHRWLGAAWRRAYRRALEDVGIEPRDLYAARHTCITLLRVAGADRDVVKSFTHSTDESERFDRRDAFEAYDHSRHDWGLKLRTIELLKIDDDEVTP